MSHCQRYPGVQVHNPQCGACGDSVHLIRDEERAHTHTHNNNSFSEQNLNWKSSNIQKNLSCSAFSPLLLFFLVENDFNRIQITGSYVRIILMLPMLWHTKLPASVKVLVVMICEWHVIPPHYFQHGLLVNVAGHTALLKIAVKPWIYIVYDGRPYVFQQESTPTDKNVVSKIVWAPTCTNDVITLNMWPPNSPDLNRFHYCIWYIPTIWLIPLKLPLPE